MLSHEIVIVCGGARGIAAAASLLWRPEPDIAIVQLCASRGRQANRE